MNQSHSASSYLDHQFHATNIGTMIEENESTLRQKIEGIYFKKSKEVIFFINLDHFLHER
jgi:hypothetical protein